MTTDFVDFCADMSWENLTKIFSSLAWIFIEPWAAVLVTPVVYGGYNQYREEMDYIGYDFDHLYTYAMEQTYKGVRNYLNPWTDTGYSLIPKIPEYKEPDFF